MLNLISLFQDSPIDGFGPLVLIVIGVLALIIIFVAFVRRYKSVRLIEFSLFTGKLEEGNLPNVFMVEPPLLFLLFKTMNF